MVVGLSIIILNFFFFKKIRKPKFRQIEPSAQDQTEGIRIQSHVCLKMKAYAYSHYKPLLLSLSVLMSKMGIILTSEIPVRMSSGGAFKAISPVDGM